MPKPLQVGTKIKNIKGTSAQRYAKPDAPRRFERRQIQKLCSEEQCRRTDCDVSHIQIRDPLHATNKWFLLYLCSLHNNPNNTDIMKTKQCVCFLVSEYKRI